jgi:hypothetical protein
LLAGPAKLGSRDLRALNAWRTATGSADNAGRGDRQRADVLVVDFGCQLAALRALAFPAQSGNIAAAANGPVLDR